MRVSDVFFFVYFILCPFRPSGTVGHKKSLQSEDDRRPLIAENGHDKVRWVHLHPCHSRNAVGGFSMHPAVLMAISDFEIDIY